MVLPPLRVRFNLVALGFVLALVAWPGAAAADLTVTDATIDGRADSSSSPPGGVLPARVTVRRSDGSDWRGTQWRFGADNFACYDTENETSNGTDDHSLNVTAPGTPGDYSADFRAREADNCSGEQSEDFNIPRALNVTAPATNKDLPEVCGLDMLLILDESGSIGTGDRRTAVRDAAKAFVASLAGTGSKVAVLEFNTRARHALSYATVDQQWITDKFTPYINDVANTPNDPGTGYDPGNYGGDEQYTNWEDAFKLAHEVNAPKAPVADLVVFVTDGDPTARNTENGPQTRLTDGSVLALRPAAFNADLVKSDGSHIFALGVGAAVTDPASARRLTAVSEFDRFTQDAQGNPTGAPFPKADYTLVENFADLAAAMKAIATQLCAASVTVTKEVDELDGAGYRPAGEDWEFTASVSTDPGTFKWVTPGPAAIPPIARTQTTDEDGSALFQWKPGNANAVSTILLSETPRAGYRFDGWTCALSGRRQIRRPVRTFGPTDHRITLKPGEYETCTARNSRIPTPTGTITIIKDAVPDSSHVFRFTGSSPIGDFTLSDDDDPVPPTQETFTNLTPGTYVVSEAQQDPLVRIAPRQTWTLTGIACSEGAEYVVSGSQVSIVLAPAQEVSCTFQNTRGDEPPPEPPDPPDPPDPPPTPVPPPPPLPPDPPESGVLPAGIESTRLRVVKRATRVARVGQRIRFTLRVTNVGSFEARGVHVADVPPAALALASFKASTRARVVRRTAIWRLGTLAPGATRTIRGSVRITAGNPGLKRNLVLAGAVNAQVASDRADTRLLGQQAPPVTG